MQYPTEAEIVVASHEQLARWWRFLPSPGSVILRLALGNPKEFYDPRAFDEALIEESELMRKIQLRLFGEFGGFTPEISKAIGWDQL